MAAQLIRLGKNEIYFEPKSVYRHSGPLFELFQLNFIFTILVTLYFLRILTKQKLQQYIAYQNFLIRSIAILL